MAVSGTYRFRERPTSLCMHISDKLDFKYKFQTIIYLYEEVDIIMRLSIQYTSNEMPKIHIQGNG